MMAVEWEEFQEWAKRQSLSVDPVNSVCVCVCVCSRKQY